MDSHTALEVCKIEAYNRVLAERVRLNRQILDNPYWFLRVDAEGHEAYEPVGRGVKSSDWCAKWMGLMVCKNFDGHKQYGDSKAVVKHKHTWCHRATCPVCFIRGWAVRGAKNIVSRLNEGVRRGLGVVEHVTVSVPPEDYGLSEKVLREKCRLALLNRGVFGGGMIFHGYRINGKRHVLAWSPHYHALGYVLGGFDRCRKCVHKREDCRSCSGFKGREMRGYEKDRYLVKVLDERQTVFGTAWYQLNHATVRVSAFRRFHVVTWFGVCGNRKYGSARLGSEDVCPVCGEDMVKCAYLGKKHICKNIGEVGYKPWFVDDGSNYVEIVGSLKAG